MNSDLDAARAEYALRTGIGDAVTFGRSFIANPDLPQRLAQGAALQQDDRDTWFTQDARGYTDYPALTMVR